MLSYIPVLGNLFKSNEKQREKIDLMIFLTPYILETPQHASQITTQIITDGQALSNAEKVLLKRNNDDYKKSVKKEGVTREMLDPHNQGLMDAVQQSKQGAPQEDTSPDVSTNK